MIVRFQSFPFFVAEKYMRNRVQVVRPSAVIPKGPLDWKGRYAEITFDHSLLFQMADTFVSVFSFFQSKAVISIYTSQRLLLASK